MSDDAVVALATALFILNSKWLRKSHIILWLLPGDHITNIKSCILIYFQPLFFLLSILSKWKSLWAEAGPGPTLGLGAGARRPRTKTWQFSFVPGKKTCFNQGGSAESSQLVFRAFGGINHPRLKGFLGLNGLEMLHQHWSWPSCAARDVSRGFGITVPSSPCTHPGPPHPKTSMKITPASTVGNHLRSPNKTFHSHS